MSGVSIRLYKDFVVEQLPEFLQQRVYAGFFQFSRETIAKAPIRTWKDFLMFSTIQEGNEDTSFWWDFFEQNKVKEDVNDTLFIIEINILENAGVRYEFHNEFENCAVVDLHKSVLVCDADAEYFGYGYVILEISPETEEAWLMCDVLTYDDCIKWLKDFY